MQILLMGNGTSIEADGSFGGATDRALKAYQAATGLEPDGSCGRKTWEKLLGVN
jgi:peptidoglycan hydrolase-like protein with peptidoglycan-binding domain